MDLRGVLVPLARGSTWRRGVFLLLGGVLALPYTLLAVGFTQLLTRGEVPRPMALVLLAVAAAIAAVPVFLSGSRALEIAAARALLGVDLPEPVAGHRIDRETRLRSALWIAVHMATGLLLMFALISAFPMALVFVARQLGIGAGQADIDQFGPLAGRHPGWLTLAGVLVLIALGYAVAGLGALAASMAPVLLGQSQGERVAALEARAARLAERNRLARELHDSVGHALTVATLQAGAARELLDTDPEFARRALAAIEETGRRAMDDLDHVLGLLRESEDGSRRPAGTAPQRTLAQLDQLVADTRAAGLPVDFRVTGAPEALPAAVSREGYRIVQEALTNAARHGRGPVRLRADVRPDGLEIELVNAVAGGTRAGPGGRGLVRSPGGRGRDGGSGGRGLDGMRERVLLLGGTLTAGPADGRWRIRARLPVGGPGGAGEGNGMSRSGRGAAPTEGASA